MITDKKENKTLLRGKVVSTKMEKTIVVEVERTFMHPRLAKVMRSIKKYKVHDEEQRANLGDNVEIYQGRPVSKTKYMYLAHIVNK